MYTQQLVQHKEHRTQNTEHSTNFHSTDKKGKSTLKHEEIIANYNVENDFVRIKNENHNLSSTMIMDV